MYKKINQKRQNLSLLALKSQRPLFLADTQFLKCLGGGGWEAFSFWPWDYLVKRVPPLRQPHLRVVVVVRGGGCTATRV